MSIQAIQILVPQSWKRPIEFQFYDVWKSKAFPMAFVNSQGIYISLVPHLQLLVLHLLLLVYNVDPGVTKAIT